MADDFRMQQAARPEKEKACFHASLSFYPGEETSNEQMVMLAKKYLEKLGMRDTQFAITKHTDRKHPHLHIIANLVDNDGKAIKDGYLGLKGKKIAQELTQQYKLIPAQKKNLQLTNTAALRKEDQIKYRIYEAVNEALPYSKTLTELEAKLKQQGIEIQYKYKGKTTQLQGISFKMNNHIFKGSSVDRQFSIANLQRRLDQSKRESIQPMQEEKKKQHRHNIRL